jgi:hypothetical protein
MSSALCLLTSTPNKFWLEFLETFREYTITIIIDDMTKDYSDLKSCYPSINFIQITDKICLENGFKNSAVPPANNSISLWDRALYYYSYLCENYESVWFINDAAFFYDENTLLNLDSIYGPVDLLSQSYIIDDKWMHWPNIKITLPKPHRLSLMYVCRLSKQIIEHVKKYAKQHDTLFFIEAMIPTLCELNKLNQITASELATISWLDRCAPISHKYDIYHSHKTIEAHAVEREILQIKSIRCANPSCLFSIHTDRTNNGGRHCCMSCRLDLGHGPACQKNICHKLGFIHITKSGGTNLKDKNKNPGIFYGDYHIEDAKYYKYLVIPCFAILRCPVERYKSLYYYNNYGSDKYIKKHDKYTDINTFVEAHKMDATLPTIFENGFQFRAQVSWLQHGDPDNTYIVLYSKTELIANITALCTQMGINYIDNKTPNINMTKYENYKELTDTSIATIKTIYAEDVKLYNELIAKNKPFCKLSELIS